MHNTYKMFTIFGLFHSAFTFFIWSSSLNTLQLQKLGVCGETCDYLVIFYSALLNGVTTEC